jgi:acyl carrier protein|nr:acyl carrier protein [Stappia sp. 28M-7]
MPITEDVRKIIASHGKLPVDVATLADDADLYAAGLSSFASVQLMLALEERFDIEFPETMLNRKTFSSIGAISSAVAELAPGEQVA